MYRGKNKDNGKLAYGGITITKVQAGSPIAYITNLYFDTTDDGHPYDHPEFIEVTLESLAQKTGLTDKNGKDIYGSILVDGAMSEGGDLVSIPTFPHFNQSSHEGCMDFDMNEPTMQKGEVVFIAPKFVVQGNFLLSSTDVPCRTERCETKSLAVCPDWELEDQFEEWTGGYGDGEFEIQNDNESDEAWIKRNRQSKAWKELQEWNQITIIGPACDNKELFKDSKKGE